MINQLFTDIAKLGTKMRIYLAIQSADSESGTLKDREILILELLKSQGPMSMTELSRFFPGVKLSTLSTDIKKLRVELDLIHMKVGRKDMRVHLIELSEKGIEKVREIKAQKAKSYIPLAKAIGKNTEEIELLHKIVNRAITLVDEEINHFAEARSK